MIAIVGASGSGKSTLLNILGGMDVPSAGRAVVAGYDLGRLGQRRADPLPAARDRVRVAADRRATSLPYLTRGPERRAADGPRRAEGAEARGRSSCSTLVGLADRATHRPDRLSGGEQQRTAIAVALANDPNVVLADEPTGELDSQTSSDVFGLLRRVNRELGTTIVIVTHDAFVSEQVQRTVAIRDGRTSTETLRRTEQTEGGDDRVISEEYAVVDRAGPAPAAAGARRRARAAQPGPAAPRGGPRGRVARPAATSAPAGRRRGADDRRRRGATRRPR